MTNLTIEQSTSAVENVNAAVIEKLYALALNSNVQDSNNTFQMQLQGNITVPAAYEDSVLYLRQKFPNLTITVQDNNFYIRFADAEVERVLIANNISSDGVGVSKTDAQSLSILPDELFKNNTTIQTFDELGRFGNIEIGAYCFQQATNLRSIDFTNVTKIKGFQSFQDTSSLTIKLNMPNLISLGSFSFQRSGITEIEDLGHITEIPGYNAASFHGCPNLTKVVLPTSCTKLGINCFSVCRNLTTIYPTDNLTTLENCCLRTLGVISSILNFKNVVNMDSIFCSSGYPNGNNRTICKQIYLPKVVDPKDKNGYINMSNKYYRGGSFGDISTEILYLRDIQHFYGPSFHNSQITNLVINNITPPTIHYTRDYTYQEYLDWKASKGENYTGAPEDVFVESSITNIYVPDSAVNTYKNAQYWSSVSSKIYPLSQLTKVATEADLQSGQIALIEEYM